MATQSAPTAAPAAPNPINIVQQQLQSGVNAGGQPLSSIQRASLQNQLNQLTGKTDTAAAQAIKDNATQTALQNSKTINRFAAVTPQAIVSQSALNQKYNLDPSTGLNGMDPTDPTKSGSSAELLRDHQKEAQIAQQMGGAPQNSQEHDLMMKMAYTPDQLAKMGYQSPTSLLNTATNSTGTMGGNGGFIPMGQTGINGQPIPGAKPYQNTVAGTSPVFDPAMLKSQGFTDDQIAQLAQTGGNLANSMQANANSLSTPNNHTNLRVLENALNAKSNTTNQQLGTSDLFNQAGLGGSMAALQQSLSQRGQEMQTKYDSFKYTVQDAAGQQSADFQRALDGYKATMDQYRYQQDKLFQVAQASKQHEYALDLMTRQNDLQKETFQWQKQIESNYVQKQLSFNPLTGEQVIFNPITGTSSSIDPMTGTVTNSGMGTTGGPHAEPPTGFHSVGTSVVSQKDLDSIFGLGTKGQWCGAATNKWSTGSPMGDSYADKMKYVTTRENPQAGYKLVLPLGVKTDKVDNGHALTVVSYNPSDNSVLCVQSNGNGEKKSTNDGKGTVTYATYKLDQLQKSYGSHWGFAPATFSAGIQSKLDAANQSGKFEQSSSSSSGPSAGGGTSYGNYINTMANNIATGKMSMTQVPANAQPMVQRVLSTKSDYNPIAIQQQQTTNATINDQAAKAFQTASAKQVSATGILDKLLQAHQSFYRPSGGLQIFGAIGNAVSSASNDKDIAKYNGYLRSGVEDYLYAINQGNKPDENQVNAMMKELDSGLPHDTLQSKIDAMKDAMQESVSSLQDQSPYLGGNSQKDNSPPAKSQTGNNSLQGLSGGLFGMIGGSQNNSMVTAQGPDGKGYQIPTDQIDTYKKAGFKILN